MLHEAAKRSEEALFLPSGTTKPAAEKPSSYLSDSFSKAFSETTFRKGVFSETSGRMGMKSRGSNCPGSA